MISNGGTRKYQLGWFSCFIGYPRMSTNDSNVWIHLNIQLIGSKSWTITKWCLQCSTLNLRGKSTLITLGPATILKTQSRLNTFASGVFKGFLVVNLPKNIPRRLIKMTRSSAGQIPQKPSRNTHKYNLYFAKQLNKNHSFLAANFSSSTDSPLDV